MLNYVLRVGELKVENENGRILEGRDGWRASVAIGPPFSESRRKF